MKNLFSRLLRCLICCHASLVFAQGLPMKTDRTVSFTTDEGTNMDVDVSPDGRRLVFDLLGDLYTVPAVGGTATQVTRGLALDWRPAWSPDGKKLAYFSDRSGSWQLHIRDLSSGTDWVPHQVKQNNWIIPNSDAVFPKWTPDGRHILVGGELYGIAGGERQTPIPDVTTLGFENGGVRVYYARYRYSQGACSLVRLDCQTGKIDTMYRTPDGFEGMALSPDKRWFAYAADSAGIRRLKLADVVKHTLRVIVDTLARHPLGHTPGFTFSPDSKFIYITYSGKIHRIDVNSGRISIIPMTIHVKADLGPLIFNTFKVSTKSFRVKYTRSAVASPDGRQLVFSALNKIYIMDLPQGRPRVLYDQPFNQFQPSWSPDGKKIAFVTWCDTIGGHVWSVPAQGERPVQLTKFPGQYQRPVFSPDGKWLAVIKAQPYYEPYRLNDTDGGLPQLNYNKLDPAEIGQLQLIDLQNSAVKVIADSVAVNNTPYFIENGKRIVYQPIRDGDDNDKPIAQMVSRDLDSKNTITVANGFAGAHKSWFMEKSASPDGRFFVYSRGEDLYLVPAQQLQAPPELFNDEKDLPAIRFAKGMDPHWEKNGKVLSWSYGNQFFRVDPGKIMRAVERAATWQKDGAETTSSFQTAYITPDQTINIHLAAAIATGRGTIVLKNARILTMQGNKVIRKGMLLIKNGRIAAVGKNFSIPRSAKVIDLAGKTIMPGIVDLHLHQYSATDILPQQHWAYLVSLAYGVTTMRDPATNYDSFGYTEVLESGQMIGPRLYSSGQPVRDYEGIVYENFDDALNTVEKRKLLGGTFMKNYLITSNKWTREQRQWLAIASRKEHLNMTNEGYYPLLLQLGQLKDGSSGIEHNPDWSDTYSDIFKFYAKSGTFLTPTLQVRSDGLGYLNSTYWHTPGTKLKHFLPQQDLDNMINAKSDSDAYHKLLFCSQMDAGIRKAGGRVTLGSHGNTKGAGPHNELWALQMGGLSNMQALQAATIMGAQAIGIQKDVGSLEVGKIADLVVLNSNPLDNIHNSKDIKYVMKNGILYDADTMNELWPAHKKCPEWKLKGDAEEPASPAKKSGENSDRDEDSE